VEARLGIHVMGRGAIRARRQKGGATEMIINSTLTNRGIRLLCVAEAAPSRRQGTGLPVSAHGIRGMRRVERRWTTTDRAFGNAGLSAAYPQVVVDVPTVKQINRVPLSIRERGS
jgi:hypothetical protein